MHQPCRFLRRSAALQLIASNVCTLLLLATSPLLADDTPLRAPIDDRSDVAKAAAPNVDGIGVVTIRRPAALRVRDLDDLSRRMSAVDWEHVRRFVSQPMIGGTVVEAGKNPYPWAALLVKEEDGRYIPFCSAALVRPQWVLTAAHCAVGVSSGGGVFVGGTNFSTDPGEFRRIEGEPKVPPGFGSAGRIDDLALLNLASEVAIAPMALAAHHTEIDEPPRDAVVLGWGMQGGGDTAVEQLRQLEIPLVDRAECDAKYVATITEKMLCAGGLGATSCDGDSGGPLMVREGDVWIGIGTASFNEYCIKPGVFTRVSSFANWIDEIL